MRKIAFILLALFCCSTAWASGTTDPIFYSGEKSGKLFNQLPNDEIDLQSSSSQTLEFGATNISHFVVSFVVPVDSFGINGVPSGRDIEVVTITGNSLGSSGSGVTVEIREINVAVDDPSWNDFDTEEPFAWTNNSTSSNDSHITDAGSILSDPDTVGTGPETIAFPGIDDAVAFDEVTMTTTITVFFLVRVTTSTSFVTFATTGSTRFRIVLTYSGAQPNTPVPTGTDTPTPSNTPTETPTFTPSSTPTGPVATATPVPTGFRLLVAGAAGYATPVAEVFYNKPANELRVPRLRYADGTSQSTAGGGGVVNFSDLGEVPPYSTNGLEVLRINAAEDAVESITIGAIAAVPTHTHLTQQVTEGSSLYLTVERVQDIMDDTLVGGVGLTGTYDDIGNTYTFDVGGLAVSEFTSPNVSQWTNDAGYIDTLTGFDASVITSGMGQDEVGFFDGNLKGDPLFVFEIGTTELGVGTGSPSSTLHVVGTTSLDGSVTVNDSGASVDFTVESDLDPNALVVDGSTDNVGVGTGTPGEKLEVSGNVFLQGPDVKIKFNDTGDGDSVPFEIQATDAVTGTDRLRFNVNAVEEMTILDNGNVGIGTNAPGAGLSVDGSAIFNDSGADVNFRIEGDSEADLFFADASTDRIGIGTNAPGTNLEISESNTSTLPALKIEQNGTGDAAIFYAIGGTTVWSHGVDNSNSDSFQFSQDNAGADVGVNTVMTLTTGGDVGVGTTDPQSLVHVLKSTGSAVLKIESTGANDAKLEIEAINGQNARVDFLRSTDNENVACIKVNISGEDIDFFSGGDTADSNQVMKYESDGQLQIRRPDGEGDPRIEFRSNGATDPKKFIGIDDGSDNLVMGTSSGGNDLVVASNTFVGINETNPTVPLDVDGDTRLQGEVNIETTTGALILPRLTTTQRTALTPVNGMLILNTTANKIQARVSGAWVDLH